MVAMKSDLIEVTLVNAFHREHLCSRHVERSEITLISILASLAKHENDVISRRVLTQWASIIGQTVKRLDIPAPPDDARVAEAFEAPMP